MRKDRRGEAANQNWLYCAMIPPKSGKRRMKFKAAKKPIAQKSRTALRSGSKQDQNDAF